MADQKTDDEDALIVVAVKANEIKNSAYALSKAPEHLTEKLQLKIEMIATVCHRIGSVHKDNFV